VPKEREARIAEQNVEKLFKKYLDSSPDEKR
jgi:hypothetical protein